MVRLRASLHLEIVALRHQLAVVNRFRRPRLRFTTVDRVLWAAVAALARPARGAPRRSQRLCSRSIAGALLDTSALKAILTTKWTDASRQRNHDEGRPSMTRH